MILLEFSILINYTFAINGILYESNCVPESNDLVYIPKTPKKTINHSGVKYFKKYVVQDDINCSMSFFDKTNNISLKEYKQFLKYKNASKSIYLTTVLGGVFNLRIEK